MRFAARFWKFSQYFSKVFSRRSRGSSSIRPPGDRPMVVDVASKSPRSAAPAIQSMPCTRAVAVIEVMMAAVN